MIIVSYDFTNDRVRSKFSKFLKQYGHKLQYSVYTISNSQRILQIILQEVELNYKKKIKNSDSVVIFQTCQPCTKRIIKYGCASNLDGKVIFFN